MCPTGPIRKSDPGPAPAEPRPERAPGGGSSTRRHAIHRMGSQNHPLRRAHPVVLPHVPHHEPSWWQPRGTPYLDGMPSPPLHGRLLPWRIPRRCWRRCQNRTSFHAGPSSLLLHEWFCSGKLPGVNVRRVIRTVECQPPRCGCNGRQCLDRHSGSLRMTGANYCCR